MLHLRIMCYSVMTQAFSEKEIPSAPNRSRAYDLPITSSDALPLSYRRLVGAKAIKLGSWDKHPAYCYRIRMSMSGICAMRGNVTPYTYLQYSQNRLQKTEQTVYERNKCPSLKLFHAQLGNSLIIIIASQVKQTTKHLSQIEPKA